MNTDISLADAALEHWDAVVIGCGVAGASFAFGLARRGQRVLVLEAGHGQTSTATSGSYPEMTMAFPDAIASRLSAQTLLSHGRQTTRINDVSDGRRHGFVPFIGKGAGGSSRLYGMAMERFLPQDFELNTGLALSANRIEAWPMDYSSMLPWYDEAEALFGVRGDRDPMTAQGRRRLQPPTPLDAGHEWLANALSANGVSPYRLPMACREVSDCQSCQGHVCTRPCKVSSVEACLYPALATGNAHAVFSCTTVRLEANRTQVTGALCEQGGERYLVKARKFVLALGALYTPTLLLRSTSAEWPTGLANASGWVGRGLMRHGIDLYAVTMPSEVRQDTDNRRKTLAFNDFYAGPDGGLGTVQSFGRLPPAAMLASELCADFRRKLPVLPGTLATLGCRAISPILRSLEENTLALAATMEDSADFNNWVKPDLDSSDPAAVQLRYALTPRDRFRMMEFRKRMSSTLRGLPFRPIRQMENNERIAHACGTCRAGKGASTSVVDLNNRTHCLDNLWVGDASYLPSSGGTNPSLTIAANALRVSNEI